MGIRSNPMTLLRRSFLSGLFKAAAAGSVVAALPKEAKAIEYGPAIPTTEPYTMPMTVMCCSTATIGPHYLNATVSILE